MTHKNRFASSCAVAAIVAAMMQPPVAQAGNVTQAPRSNSISSGFTNSVANQAALTKAQKVALLRQNVKYVFVLFQENRSFDSYFGTYPGANGLFSQPASQTAGFAQPIVNIDGTVGTISPFLIPQTVKTATTPSTTVQIYPADTDSVDHSHVGIDNSLDVVSGVAQNDRYALNEEGLTTLGGQIVSRSTGLPTSSNPSLAQKQKGELVMGHVDCDTIPFLWQYADRFTLFDNFHQTIIGPSTPNAIAMIAGQSGETQWALHPGEGSNNTASSAVKTSGGEPVVGDPGPFAGSNFDESPIKPPYGPNDESPATPAFNQTYASLPLSFMGNNILTTIQSDENPALDLLDVQHDIKKIASNNLAPVSWGWFQEGYDHEPTDGNGPATYANYITHHNGPQYFGYVGDNPAVASNLHGLNDFFTAVASNALSPTGGVYYVRGGYGNNDGLTPLDKNPTVQANFTGNDDHPGYSDAQISEALLADEINAIASSPYWSQSVIIITYDETDGLYDHAVPSIRSFDPEGSPLSGGPRIPAIVISPYGNVHAISHEYGEHSSVIKFIDELFSLTPLGDLPDEVKARQLGETELGQSQLGPADSLAGMDDLLDAFDNDRLSGTVATLPPEYAMIPTSAVKSLPHFGGQGCYALNIVPTDYVNGKLIDPAPVDFNPRPSSTPGVPTSGNWTP
jgi:phospholipase C